MTLVASFQKGFSVIISGSIAIFFLSGCQKFASSAPQVCLREHCFNVEIVSKGKDMERGLQFRKFLPPEAGMLFVFDAPKRQSFWMKDTLISLDIIWIDYAHRVVDVIADVPPCTADPCPVYTPKNEALYVLELNGGVSRSIGLNIGDRAEFKIE